MNNDLKIVTVIQARMNSSRLPKKISLPLAGKPLLWRMAERVLKSDLKGILVIAATTDKDDDHIADICREYNLNLFRGHPTDLLDRHFNVALEYEADAVVKIPSDCPLIDRRIIDRVLKKYLDNSDKYDYISNLHPASYPDGNDVEIMSLNALKIAWKNATKVFEREHTTPYIWENPDQFRIGNVEWETGLDYSMSHRFTIDYLEDYLFIKAVYDELYIMNQDFSLNDVLDLLERNPEIKKINEKYNGVNWYRNHLTELKTVSEKQTKII
jgi:spore coat polysaccharide biosynthesis protein SpsF